MQSPELNKDTIFSSPLGQVSDFVFDTNVVDVFPDMIKRSVPGYQTILSTVGHLVHEYVQDNSQLYDLGCSLGAVTVSMRRALDNQGRQGCNIIAIDNSQAMVEKCQAHLNAYRSEVATHVICQDILETPIDNASIVVLNFTLQFLAPEDRLKLLTTIYQGLKPGGLLVLSEKLTFNDDKVGDVIEELHLDFKRANGYSELEIAQKRSALENVMRTDTLDTHHNRLQQAGFNHINQWYQCFNFASFIAIK